MNRIIYLCLLFSLASNVEARGSNLQSAPEWFIHVLTIIFVIFLLFFLIKRPIQTIKLLFAVVVSCLFLLTVDHLQKNYGLVVLIVAVPILWIAIMKFIDLMFKDNKDS